MEKSVRKLDVAETASMDLMSLNNQIVRMRPLVKKAKIPTIRKLVRNIKKLKSKKGSDAELEKNKRKMQRLIAEIETLKVLKADKVAKYALARTDTFEDVCKQPNVSEVSRAMARLADDKGIQVVVKKFREEHEDWKSLAAFLISRNTGRKMKKKKKVDKKKDDRITKKKILTKKADLENLKVQMKEKGADISVGTNDDDDVDGNEDEIPEMTSVDDADIVGSEESDDGDDDNGADSERNENSNSDDGGITVETNVCLADKNINDDVEYVLQDDRQSKIQKSKPGSKKIESKMSKSDSKHKHKRDKDAPVVEKVLDSKKKVLETNKESKQSQKGAGKNPKSKEMAIVQLNLQDMTEEPEVEIEKQPAKEALPEFLLHEPKTKTKDSFFLGGEDSSSIDEGDEDERSDDGDEDAPDHQRASLRSTFVGSLGDDSSKNRNRKRELQKNRFNDKSKRKGFPQNPSKKSFGPGNKGFKDERHHNKRNSNDRFNRKVPNSRDQWKQKQAQGTQSRESAKDKVPVHPSWEASKKRKQQLSVQVFQGKKIKFDED